MWQTDGRTDRRTDGRTDWTIHRAAWSQLKIIREMGLWSHYTTVTGQLWHDPVRFWYLNHQIFVKDYMKGHPITHPWGQDMRCYLWVQSLDHSFTFVIPRPRHSKNPFDGFVQERRNSSALAMELRLSCTKPSNCVNIFNNTIFYSWFIDIYIHAR